MNTVTTGTLNSTTAAGELKDLAPVSAHKVDLMMGPYRSGKTKWLINELIDHCQEHPFAGAMVLVPSQRYQKLLEERIHEALELRAGGKTEALGLVGLKVGSFYRVCQDVLRRAGKSFRVIPDKVRPALIQRVLHELDASEQLTALKPIISFNGTHLSILDLVDEFERAALSPLEVLEQLEETAQSESRYMELARIYQAYWQRLDALGYIDERGLAFRAREVLAAGSFDKPLFSLLCVDGFDRFNALQLQVLSGLTRFSEKTKICFDYCLDETPTGLREAPKPKQKNAIAKTMSALKKASAASARAAAGSDVVQLCLFGGEAEATAVAGVSQTQKSSLQSCETAKNFSDIGKDSHANAAARHYEWKESSYAELIKTLGGAYNLILPRVGGERSRSTDVVKLRMGDRFFEMEELARRIKEHLQSGKTTAAQILVVARSLRSYRVPIAAAFDMAGLSYFIDESVSLPALPMVQFILKLLSLSIDNFQRRAVLDCLRSPYLKRSVLGLSKTQINRLDHLSLTVNLVAGAEQWQMLAMTGGADGEVEALLNFFDLIKIPSQGTLSELIAWTEDLLEQILEWQFDDYSCDQFDRFEEAKVVDEVKRALAALMHEEAIFGASTYSAPAYLQRLTSLIERANIRKLPRSKNAITICGADLAANKSFELVFIAGLAEGEFPRRSARKGFIGLDEVARWGSFGINIQNPRFHAGFEAALFNSLVERGRQQVVFSCPSFELNGDELLPSFFMTQGKSLEESGIITTVPFDRALTRPLSARDALSGWLWHTNQSEPSGRLLWVPEVSEQLERIAEPVVVAHARAYGAQKSVYNGYLKDFIEAGVTSVKLPEFFSASKLNDYGQCPFKYWVRHILKCQPYEEPESGLPRRILGELYHKAMELFYRLMQERNLRLAESDTASCETAFDEAVELALGWLTSRSDVRQSEFWHYERIEIVFRLKRFFQRELTRALRDKERFRPFLLEAGFGFAEQDSAPPLVIEHEGKSIRLRGRIDRIDIEDGMSSDGERRARVIDYKSGSSPITKEDALRGRNIQLPLYAMAVERSILKGSDVIAAAYLSVSSGDAIGSLALGSADKPRSQDDEERLKIAQIVEGHVRSFVDGIANGEFTVKPNGASVCKSCPHSTICRVGEMAAVARFQE